MKTCSRCFQQKLEEEFDRERAKNDGRQSWCRECHNEYALVRLARNITKKTNYDKRDSPWGRSSHWWAERKRQCRGECQVCGAPATERDHDHDTGLGRGWLCLRCNLAEGLMRSNPVFIENLANYVRSNGDFPHGMRVLEIFEGPTSDVSPRQ